MSFLSSVFSGSSNSYSPGAGSAAQQAQNQTANANYNTANSGLNSLAASLAQQAQGGGPNLANAQLQSATGQNVANQAALMAGQRGASSNPALIARQAAQQGANIQQQAVGQSAQNVLAQQLAAQQQLGGVLGTQGSLANQNYSTTQGAINQANQIGSQQASQNASMNQGLIGGAANAIGSITGLFADGGDVKPFNMNSGSNFGFNFTNMKPAALMQNMNANIPIAAQSVLGAKPQVIQDPTQNYAQGGLALPFSPMDLTKGGPIKARSQQEKAEVPGNSVKNDKIPGMLSEGEIVIPRDVAQSSNAPTLAAQFVSAVKSGKHRKSNG